MLLFRKNQAYEQASGLHNRQLDRVSWAMAVDWPCSDATCLVDVSIFFIFFRSGRGKAESEAPGGGSPRRQEGGSPIFY